MPDELESVTVGAGRTVYHGGGVHGFVAGARVPLPKSHVEQLAPGGHVERDEAPAKGGKKAAKSSDAPASAVAAQPLTPAADGQPEG